VAGQLIKKGDNLWLVKIFLRRDPRTGKRKFHAKIIHGTKREAETYKTAILREKDLGRLIEATSITVDEFLNKWLEAAARPRLRERTFEEYRYNLDRHVRPAFGGVKLSDLRPLDIELLYSSMRERGLTRTPRYVHAILSSALKYAVKMRLLLNNPAGAVEAPRYARREMCSFSSEQAVAFLKAAADDSLGVLFAFALSTGMRPEEYLGLQWKDVDLTRGTATVQRTLVLRKGGGWYFGEPKTPRSRRTVPLPASLVRALAEHRRCQMVARLKAGPDYQSRDFVFATDDGAPLNIRNVTQRHFKPLLKKAELPRTIRLYDLRHSCATLLLEANENPKVVSERLGHASVVLTLDTYSHVLPSMQRGATEKLEDILFGCSPTVTANLERRITNE
jgi:integrase